MALEGRGPGIKPRYFLRGGLTLCWKRDSWCMIAIITGTDEFQRFAALDAGLYQRFFSLNIAQTLSVFVGAVAQAVSSNGMAQSRQNAVSRMCEMRCRKASIKSPSMA